MFALLLRDHDVIAVAASGPGHSPVAMYAATAASTSFTRAERARSSVRSRLAQSRQATANMPGPTVSSHRGPSARSRAPRGPRAASRPPRRPSPGRERRGPQPAAVSGTSSPARSCRGHRWCRWACGPIWHIEQAQARGPRLAPGRRPVRPRPASAGRSCLRPAAAGHPRLPGRHRRSRGAGRGRVAAPRVRQSSQRGPRGPGRDGRDELLELGEWDTAGPLEEPSGVLGPVRTRVIATAPIRACGASCAREGRRGQAARTVRAARRR